MMTPNNIKIVGGVCTVVSVASVAASPVLISVANKKAAEILAFHGLEGAPLRERMKYTWKAYIPTAIVMAAGVAAATGSGIVNHKLTGALVGEITAHAASVATSNEAKEAVFRTIKEKYGLDVEQELRDGATQAITSGGRATKFINNPILKASGSEGTGKMLIVDDTFGHKFRGSMEDVKAAVNECNAAIVNGEDVCLRDFYDSLGIDTGSIAQSLCPKEGELLELTWSTDMTDGEPCLHFGFRELVVPNY